MKNLLLLLLFIISINCIAQKPELKGFKIGSQLSGAKKIRTTLLNKPYEISCETMQNGVIYCIYANPINSDGTDRFIDDVEFLELLRALKNKFEFDFYDKKFEQGAQVKVKKDIYSCSILTLEHNKSYELPWDIVLMILDEDLQEIIWKKEREKRNKSLDF